MKVRLLTFNGCPNERPAEGRLKEVLGEEGIQAEIERVEMTEEAAQSERFLGSPTIQVDGLDIEPAARTRTDYAMACRTYIVDGRLTGVPPKELIRAAIRGE